MKKPNKNTTKINSHKKNSKSVISTFSCAKVFQNVLNAAQNSKSCEFSLRRKSMEISDTLKNCIKESKENNLEFKSCSIQLSRVMDIKDDNTNVDKYKQQNKKRPEKKLKTITSSKITKMTPLRQIPKKVKICESKQGSIPLEVEHEINKYAKESITLGWSLMRKYMPFFIQHCINKRELDVFSNGLKFFANNLPSREIVKIYMRKYETIYKDILEERVKSLTSMDERNLFYFNLCWHLINQYAIKSDSFLNEENKNRIFCCGDYSFTSDYKNIIEITEGLSKNGKKRGENVFFCVSATGKVFSPVVINKGITLKTYESSIYADNKYCQEASEDGRMCAEAFHHWLITAFQPHLVNDKIQKPVILFFNSDSPYLSIPVLDFCKENEIILFCIPSQLSNLLNPLNMSCLDSLGMEYCRIFRKRAEETVGKAKEFSPLILIAAMDRINFNGCAQSAFEKSGLLKKESYSLETKKKVPHASIESRLPSYLKDCSYDLGKQMGKLMCYQEMMSMTSPDSNQISDVEKRFFNKIKKFYLQQSEKCTEMLDYYDDSSRKATQPEIRANPIITPPNFHLNAENIFRIQSNPNSNQISSDY